MEILQGSEKKFRDILMPLYTKFAVDKLQTRINGDLLSIHYPSKSNKILEETYAFIHKIGKKKGYKVSRKNLPYKKAIAFYVKKQWDKEKKEKVV